jgi:hypothetical protein
MNMSAVVVLVRSRSEMMPAYCVYCRCSQAGKPGARKRKLGAAAGGGSMDVLPTNLIMSTGFKPPKVRHLG